MPRNGRNVHRYWRVFLETNGDPPWPCHECKEPVLQIGRQTWDGNIHHLDGDVENDVPDNLVVMHVICHQRKHPVTEEMREQISRKLRGRPSPTRGMRFSAEVNARKGRSGPSNANYGKQASRETREKMSLARRGRPLTWKHRWAISRGQLDMYRDERGIDINRRRSESLRVAHERMDRTPMHCACGAGPFQGTRGLNMHRGKLPCFA